MQRDQGPHDTFGKAGSTLSSADGAYHTSVWSAVLDLLKLRVSHEGYETWLAPTKAVSASGQTLTVEVPNSFFADWLGQHYAADIRAALATVGADGTEVRFLPRVTGPAVMGNRARPVQATRQDQVRLHARYSFDSFVVGESNRLAYAAARNVAENPGRTYNPLFLYGGVGMGKTHLLQAIGNHCLARRNDVRIQYAPAEAVFIELIQAIEQNTRLEFKSRYRGLDVLLLDDIHYLVGKERLQEEIFHIFNHLQDAGSQIVFTSDRPPRDIATLEERLVSRLGSGLVVDIQPPDIETRMAIIRRRAAAEHLELPEEVCLYIATRIKSNVRAIEGSFVRLLAVASLEGRPIDVALAEEALRDLVPQETVVDHGRILRVVAENFAVPIADLCGERRTKPYALARQTAMYLMRQMLNLSLKEIGHYCGGRDHTTVMHALAKVNEMRTADPGFAARLTALSNRITGG